VIEQYEELLTTYTGLLGESVEGHAGTTEAAIETAYSAYTKVNVRWTDADGDPRISYKDPVNGWYHAADKSITPVQIYAYEPSSGSVVGGTPVSANVTPGSFGIPANARFVKVKIYLLLSEGSGSGSEAYIVSGTITGKGGVEGEFYAHQSAAELDSHEWKSYQNLAVRIKSDGTFAVGFLPFKATGYNIKVIITAVGWSR
jgi:hypothetical protein